jgi:hypothetical protein
MLLSLGLFASGCTSSQAALVRSQSAAEWGCDKEAINVSYLGNDLYQASGCGHVEEYGFHPEGVCNHDHSCPLRKGR